MNKSDQINELAAALSKAQGEFTNPAPDATVKVRSDKGSYDFKYATLGNVIDTIRPVLSKHGLALVIGCHSSSPHEGPREDVSAMLLHSSGQWIESRLSLPLCQRAQELGSQLSYRQRYLIRMLLNLATDEDDDANVADGNAVEKATAKAPYKPRYQKTGTPDPIGPAEDPAATLGKPAAPADPAGKPSVAAGFLNSLKAASTIAQVDGMIQQIALVKNSITDEERSKLREAVDAARLRITAKPYQPPNAQQLLGEVYQLAGKLGGLFDPILRRHGGDPDAAGYGLGLDSLKNVRDECAKAIG